MKIVIYIVDISHSLYKSNSIVNPGLYNTLLFGKYYAGSDKIFLEYVRYHSGLEHEMSITDRILFPLLFYNI